MSGQSLSRESILSMPAGSELDALVAGRVFAWPEPEFIANLYHDPARPVFGWKECLRAHPDGECQHVWRIARHEYYPAPEYSTDIAAAWEVVEQITKSLADSKAGDWWLDGLGYRCCDEDADGTHGRWRCHFGREVGEERESIYATADAAPLAICRAALLAVHSGGREGKGEE